MSNTNDGRGYEPRTPYRSTWDAYERRKAEWIRENPGASSERYSDAMRAIAEELGA